MLVVSERTRFDGLGDARAFASRSPTMCLPNAASTVTNMTQDASGALLTMSQRTPFGDASAVFGSVPTWAWAAGGGLLAGVVVGAIAFRKKKGR